MWQPPGEGRAALAALAADMARQLESRGPDGEGAWADEAAGFAVGHRRLAILDLSREALQPMVSPDGRFVLAYNGEVYNFRDLRAELEGGGAVFRSDGDTEVVLQALVRWGVERALGRFVGMFAFALWDARERRLVLARDRLGIKPLYYGSLPGRSGSGRTLFFGSQLRSFRPHPAFRPELDRGALALFFRHGYVPAPRSIFDGIRKLPPGSWVELSAPDASEAGARPRTYWDARAVALEGSADPLDLSFEEAREELELCLRRAVEARLVSDVPLGAFLSGGIDSSTVVALMRGGNGRPVQTFTIGFREEGYDEAGHAAAVARHLGTEHAELYLSADEARAVIPSIPESWDEPFADSSQIPTSLVSEFARRQVKVVLSGDGGDELFGGYPRYFLASRLRRALRLLPAGLRKATAAGIARVPPAVWEGVATRTSRFGGLGLQPGWAGQRATRMAELLETLGDEDLYRSLVSHWKRPAELVRGAEEPVTPLADPSYAAGLPGFLERMMLLDTVTYLPDDILCKVDRASMAHGLEARVPLLDHRVVELVWRLPRSLRVGPAPGKRLLRAVLQRFVPPALFERPKMGFGVPLGEWLRGPLREWCEELLDERRLEEDGLLRAGPVRRLWEEHKSGTRGWGYYLWDVLCFQAWRSRWHSGGG